MNTKHDNDKHEREQAEKRQRDAQAQAKADKDKAEKAAKEEQERLEREHPQSSPSADRRPPAHKTAPPPFSHPGPTDPDRPDLGVTDDPRLPTYQAPQSQDKAAK